MKIVEDDDDNGSMTSKLGYARIAPVEEHVEVEDPCTTNNANQDDYQLSESPPIEWTITDPVVTESMSQELRTYFNQTLHDKQQNRSDAKKSRGWYSEATSSPTFNDDLMAGLQKLENLKTQQDKGELVPVVAQRRQHYWIQDHLDLLNEWVWCLPIAVWPETMAGLCLEPTTDGKYEFRRIGLCVCRRTGNRNWEEDVVFENWRGVPMATVSVV